MTCTVISVLVFAVDAHVRTPCSDTVMASEPVWDENVMPPYDLSSVAVNVTDSDSPGSLVNSDALVNEGASLSEIRYNHVHT